MDLKFKPGDLVRFNSSVFGEKDEPLAVVLEVDAEMGAVRIRWIDEIQRAERLPADWLLKVTSSK
jgi:transcription antitermination factor NusG